MHEKFILLTINALTGEVKTGVLISVSLSDAISYALQEGMLNPDIQVGAVVPYEDWKKLGEVTDEKMNELELSPEAFGVAVN